MSLNTHRHVGYFNPDLFKEPLHVVGAGALGSHFVDTVASMGISNIDVYDFDIVESHNIANQVYERGCIGKKKVDALKEHIQKKSGVDIVTHDEEVHKLEVGGVIVLAVDSIKARKEIFLASASRNPKIRWLIDMRMGIDQGDVLFIDPNNRVHTSGYIKCTDPDVGYQESPCNSRAISSTAKFISSFAAHQLVFASKKENSIEPFPRYVICMDGLIQNIDWEK